MLLALFETGLSHVNHSSLESLHYAANSRLFEHRVVSRKRKKPRATSAFRGYGLYDRAYAGFCMCLSSSATTGEKTNTLQSPLIQPLVGQPTTARSDAAWRAQYIIHDNDSVFRSAAVKQFLATIGTESVRTGYRRPDQNGRRAVSGVLRRELIDRIISLNERHLCRLEEYIDRYYHSGDCCVGPLTSLALRSEIGNIKRFASADKLVSCVGLDPRDGD